MTLLKTPFPKVFKWDLSQRKEYSAHLTQLKIKKKKTLALTYVHRGGKENTKGLTENIKIMTNDSAHLGCRYVSSARRLSTPARSRASRGPASPPGT